MEFGIWNLGFKLANCQLPTANCQLLKWKELKCIARINGHIYILYAITIKKLVRTDFSLYD
ncbi:MAG: hypothetical protein EA359_08725 [Balneolaceae bacterium]|nr:MAG: hypothetical protein EA359_08725 [Balneolaceae bacterium]